MAEMRFDSFLKDLKSKMNRDIVTTRSKCNRLHSIPEGSVRTIKEVAAKAGVSVATISRVINNDPAVQASTRERVLAVIRELNYEPNLLGRHLRKAQTKKILVLIPSISNQFYSKIITKMESVAQDAGYTVLVCMSHSNREIEQSYLDMLKTKVVDGLIFLTSNLTAQEMTAISEHYPIVQCCEFIAGSVTDIVSIDNEKAAYDAVSFLLEQGHRRVAFFGSSEKYCSGLMREEGYRNALKDHGIPVDESLLFYDSYGYPGGKRLADAMLRVEDRPTAVFCISDSIAIGCINELIHLGIKIPDEVSVIGFDDTSIAKVFCPAISTVAQPQVEIGKLSMEFLIERIKGTDRPPAFISLPHQLILRETTTPAPDTGK